MEGKKDHDVLYKHEVGIVYIYTSYGLIKEGI